MVRENHWSRLPILLLTLWASWFLGCGDHGDDDAGSIDDDAADDDDITDDDVTDDDVSDDDIGDDDIGDDDAGDDDIGDDDAGDDDAGDDDDDDNDDNDDNDDATPRNFDHGEVKIDWVDGDGYGRDGVSMALTPDGTRYLAAIHRRQLVLVRYRPNGDHPVTTIASGAYFPALTADRNGHLHVAYYSTLADRLVYGNNVQGAWRFHTVSEYPPHYNLIRLQVDGNGKAYILYFDDINHELKLLTNRQGSWTASVVQANPGGVVGLDLALDSGNRVHVIYRSALNGIVYAVEQDGAWETERIIPTFYILSGNNAVIALDADDRPHVAFQHETLYSGYAIIYAVRTGDGWQRLAINNLIGEYFSLSLGPNGKAYLTYSVGNAIRYSTNCSGSWETESLDIPDSYYLYLTGMLGPDGRIHLGYADYSTGGLNYASCAVDASDVSYETLVSGHYVGESVHALQTADDERHLTYFDQTEYRIRHAVRHGNAWQFEPLGRESYDNNNLARDASGDLHVCYYKYPGGGLEYATDAGGAWTSENLDPEGNGFSDCAIGVNDAGVVRIVYSNDEGLQVIDNEDGSWHRRLLWQLGGTDQSLGSAVDADGALHIAYVRYEPDQIIYATDQTGEWVFETAAAIDPHFSSEGVSLALDFYGAVHLAYADDEAGVISYATNLTGVWRTEEIDAVNGYYPRVVGDYDGRAHLVYFDFDTEDLRYATNRHGYWSDVLIDRAGTVGEFSSLLLTPGGNLTAYYLADSSLWQAVFPLGYEEEAGVLQGAEQ